KPRSARQSGRQRCRRAGRRGPPHDGIQFGSRCSCRIGFCGGVPHCRRCHRTLTTWCPFHHERSSGMTRSNPATNPTTRNRTILISGASAAGPALAFWLHRYGFAVTVVEKAPAPRGGGYPIDVRGAALHVVQRMGILPVLRDAHIERRQMTFLGADGGEVVSFDPRDTADTSDVGDLEIRRGELAAALHTAIRDDVELLFNDAIDTLQQSDTGVAVTFRSGAERTFDLVIGADGMHSRTRELLFGGEEQFHRYLGYCFAGFSIPNYLNLSHELVLWNTPGRAAG